MALMRTETQEACLNCKIRVYIEICNGSIHVKNRKYEKNITISVDKICAK